MNDPNIKGGSRVACSAAIVLACIVLYGLAIIIETSFPSGPAAADNHVVAGFFSN